MILFWSMHIARTLTGDSGCRTSVHDDDKHSTWVWLSDFDKWLSDVIPKH